MSGSTHVKIISTYFVLGMETPSIRFIEPEQEREYHNEKNRLFRNQLDLIKPALEELFEKLKNDKKSDIKIREYNCQLPEIIDDLPDRASKGQDRPCRYHLFLTQLTSVAGMVYIQIAFDKYPGDKALQTLKRLIEKKINNTLRKI